jgi:hypothetical protein
VSGRPEGGARSAITIQRSSRRCRLRRCRRRPRSSRWGLGTPCACTRAQAASCSPACSRGANSSPMARAADVPPDFGPARLAPLLHLLCRSTVVRPRRDERSRASRLRRRALAIQAERSLRVRDGQRPEPHGADRHTCAAAQPQRAGARRRRRWKALQSYEPPPYDRCPAASSTSVAACAHHQSRPNALRRRRL